ncbi:hypothetical protein H0O01_05010 [Candidatus Micrarchaeota archaeon]|nr:hypothetical protein [Candidatus Micrarchaeota archaeon]
MNGRHMAFMNGLVKTGKIAPVAGEAFADAKRITVPEFVNRILEDREGGRFLQACARSLDMVIDRIRTVWRGYRKEELEARDEKKDLGLAVQVRVEAIESRPADEGPDPLRSKAERLIADTLFAIYERSDGAMDRRKWREAVDGIKEELDAGIKERIAKTEQSTMDFVFITVKEKEIVDNIWKAGVEQAESRVFGEERKHSRSRAPAAS